MTDYDDSKARSYEITGSGMKPPSSKWINIKCPFCSGVVRAYLWSLWGGGKKCSCGSKHSAWGQTTPPLGKEYVPVKMKFMKVKK